MFFLIHRKTQECEINLCNNGCMFNFKGDYRVFKEMMENQQVQRRAGAWFDAGNRRATTYPDKIALTYK